MKKTIKVLAITFAIVIAFVSCVYAAEKLQVAGNTKPAFSYADQAQGNVQNV